jgi:hypothetical protein
MRRLLVVMMICGSISSLAAQGASTTDPITREAYEASDASG